MNEFTLTDDLLKRVTEFKRVVQAVVGEEVDLDNCFSLIFDRGLDSMLADILGNIEQPVLLASFQQLASRYPAEVYGYVAETLRKGEAVNEDRERLRKKLGFQPPDRPER
jgi:hypothetical protein